MGLRRGARITVWSMETHEKYTVANISTSKWDKEKRQYGETDYSNHYARFIGSAHSIAQNFGEKEHVYVGDFELTTSKGKNGVWYTNLAIFSFLDKEGNELKEYAGSGNNAVDDGFNIIPDDAPEELPFQ